jgi:hypothetical protein
MSMSYISDIQVWVSAEGDNSDAFDLSLSLDIHVEFQETRW